MRDEHVLDIRDLRLPLDASERDLLREILEREVIDVDELGKSLGISNEGVIDLVGRLAARLVAFQSFAIDATPPLGTSSAHDVARRRASTGRLRAR